MQSSTAKAGFPVAAHSPHFIFICSVCNMKRWKHPSFSLWPDKLSYHLPCRSRSRKQKKTMKYYSTLRCSQSSGHWSFKSFPAACKVIKSSPSINSCESKIMHLLMLWSLWSRKKSILCLKNTSSGFCLQLQWQHGEINQRDEEMSFGVNHSLLHTMGLCADTMRNTNVCGWMNCSRNRSTLPCCIKGNCIFC